MGDIKELMKYAETFMDKVEQMMKDASEKLVELTKLLEKIEGKLKDGDKDAQSATRGQ